MIHRKSNRRGRYGILALLLITLFLSSCKAPIGGTGKSPVYLSAREDDTYGVLCDVYPPVITENDLAEINIKSIYKDPTGSTATDFADVLLTEYRVTYFRADNNPSVPEPFVHSLPNSVVPAGAELTLEFFIIKQAAKLEPPLKELAFGGGEGEIFLNAFVEFFGEDLAGNAVGADIVIPMWVSDY